MAVGKAADVTGVSQELRGDDRADPIELDERSA